MFGYIYFVKFTICSVERATEIFQFRWLHLTMDLNMKTHHVCNWKGKTEIFILYRVWHCILYGFLSWLGNSCGVTAGLQTMDSNIHHLSYNIVESNPNNDGLLFLIQTHTWSPWIVKGFPSRRPTLCIIHLHKRDYQRNRPRRTVPDLDWSGYVASLCHNTEIHEKQVYT